MKVLKHIGKSKNVRKNSPRIKGDIKELSS